MTRIPPDFPHPAPAAAVPGAQPKVLATHFGNVFTAPAGQDIAARHEVCEDLVQQLLAYSGRKRSERPDWTREQVREKVVASTRQKAFAWGLSPAETEWVVKRFESIDQA
jgi:hypothetical protein